jgi:colanic acid biosynthesis glycosyl transferase WcaI
LKIAVLCPHYEPDTAPTGAVITRIVAELAALGHRIEVITSLPWYRDHRIEEGFAGHPWRIEDTPWGRITRLHPFPTSDRRNILRRAAAFGGFSALTAAVASYGGRANIVLAMSPPLTLGVSGWIAARARRASLVFNVQDVYPDVAVELGYLTNGRVIAAARRLERWCYDHADAVTVLSDDLRDNVAAKTRRPERVHVIPNFVDTAWITPSDHDNAYRREFGLGDRTVIMYAGNIGLSQSLAMVLDAAAALAYDDGIVFVVNGNGSARPELERRAAGMSNVIFVDMQPWDRLPEVLAAGDIHLVPLKSGLARSSVPSKTYSILAAGRPLVASVDEGSEVARVVERAGAGVAVAPDDSEALTKALRSLVDSPPERARMGAAGREFIEGWASPAAVAQAYDDLFARLRHL